MTLRICVLIRVFNNPDTIGALVRDFLEHTDHPILIVDDGSDFNVENFLYSWHVRDAVISGRVRVLRLDRHLGKSPSLRLAFAQLASTGFTHVLLTDGRGRVPASELKKLLDQTLKAPWDLIIGCRQFELPSGPAAKPRGGWFSKFFVSYQTGLQVKDPRSVFRVYPLFTVQTLPLFRKWSDFDLEMLIRLIWSGVHVQEVDIHIKETSAIEAQLPAGQGWVQRWARRAHISILQTALVVVSLFKTHRAPGEASLALGLGVFIGCSPFFGFHSLIVMGVAVLFRLNVVVMWLGTHVTNPLIAPLVIWAEFWVGRRLLGGPEIAGGHPGFTQWVVGSIVVGGVLGVVTAMVTWITMFRVQLRRGHALGQHPKLGRLSRAILLRLIQLGGLRAAHIYVYCLTIYYYLFAANARRGFDEYWRLRAPEKGWRWRQGRIWIQFLTWGRVLIDQLVVEQNQGPTHPVPIPIYGRDGLFELMERGGPVILVGAHVGTLTVAQLPQSVHPVEFGLEPEALGPQRPMALLPLLGALAPVDLSPFLEAVVQRRPMIAVFGLKRPGSNGGYDLLSYKLQTSVGQNHLGENELALTLVQDLFRILEEVLKRYPEQWFNFYPLWSYLPRATSMK